MGEIFPLDEMGGRIAVASGARSGPGVGAGRYPVPVEGGGGRFGRPGKDGCAVGILGDKIGIGWLSGDEPDPDVLCEELLAPLRRLSSFARSLVSSQALRRRSISSLNLPREINPSPSRTTVADRASFPFPIRRPFSFRVAW